MQIILDANILISYLLHRNRRSAVILTVEAVLNGAIDLWLPTNAVDEFERSVSTKKYLTQRIGADEAAEFIELLTRLSRSLAPLGEHLSSVSRDLKDTYLLDVTRWYRPDYLVTGDNDLLTLREIDGIPILGPARFVQILRDLGLIDPDQGAEDS